MANEWRWRAAAVFLALALLAGTAAGTAWAQEPTRVVTDDEVNAISKNLFCPVCESTPLDVCATQACADWREVVRLKLSQGQSEQEIRAYFAEQYGPRALSEPPREGFTLLAWLGSIAVVIAGAAIFARSVRRLRAQDRASVVVAPAAPSEDPPLDDYHARIERELQER